MTVPNVPNRDGFGGWTYSTRFPDPRVHTDEFPNRHFHEEPVYHMSGPVSAGTHLVLRTQPPKEIAIAYVLWFFLSALGIHRFYLGKTGTGIAMLLCTLSLVGYPVTLVWLIVDAFLIPGMVRTYNAGG